ncbi:rho guanine nucleotide exchange factor 12-like protein [Leptotrombidium deliense]|uniref:Rho guanine nucleotide exchange factor 12-like protein n=1 Tax=Leptotrombidium deliense TaxID=299467 RepID=A0A443STM6_9ACAR|nr:rho guanine nucleotide exchange factor 12-like protein [Leptotrombidium deliense]
MAAEDNYCISREQQQLQKQSEGLVSLTPLNLASSSTSAIRKQRTTKWRTSGGRIVDNILKGLTGYSSSSAQHSFDQQSQQHSESHSPPLISSESDDESEPNENNNATTATATTPATSTAATLTPTTSLASMVSSQSSVTITRSESLKQRRKEAKQFYRKRSDPTTDRSQNNMDETPASVDEEENVEKGEEEYEEYENPPEPNIPPPPPPPEPFGLIPPPLPPRNKNNKRSEIIKELFETEQTHRLEVEASKFCALQINGGQQLLKQLLKQRIKKDSKFSQFLNEAQSQSICKRDLIWRLTKQKSVDAHMYTLKIQVNPITKMIHQPVLKVQDLLLKNLATDARAFFIVSTKENALHEFVANTINERKLWTQHIQTCDEEQEKKVLNVDGVCMSGGGDALETNNTLPQQQQQRQPEEVNEQPRGRIEGTIRFVTSEDEEVLIHNPNEIQVNQIKHEYALHIITNEQKLIQLNQQMRQLIQEKQRLINVIKVENEWNEEKMERSERKMALLQKSVELCSLLCDDEEKEKKLTFLKEFKQEFDWFVENEEKNCIYF